MSLGLGLCLHSCPCAASPSWCQSPGLSAEAVVAIAHMVLIGPLSALHGAMACLRRGCHSHLVPSLGRPHAILIYTVHGSFFQPSSWQGYQQVLLVTSHMPHRGYGGHDKGT